MAKNQPISFKRDARDYYVQFLFQGSKYPVKIQIYISFLINLKHHHADC